MKTQNQIKIREAEEWLNNLADVDLRVPVAMVKLDISDIRAIQANVLAWAIAVSREYVDDPLKNQYPAQAILRRLEEAWKELK